MLSIVGLVQAWDRVAPDRSAPLFLVTRGAQSVGERPEPFGDRPGSRGRPGAGHRRRIPPAALQAGGSRPRGRRWRTRFAPRGVQSADDEDEVAWRGPERFVHRYLPAPGLPPEGERGSTRGDEPYRLAVRQPGTLDGLALQTVRRRPPGPGEVEIEVVAAGLNFSDVMKALGMYPGLPEGPVPLGAECSGRITAVGEGVDRPSRRRRGAGGRRLRLRQPRRDAGRAGRAQAARLSFEEAATLPIAFLTAAYALE